jgi:pilus assembly protein CpaF
MTSLELHFDITGPGGKKSVTLLGPGPHWIGRDAGCALALTENNVSRRHASVEVVPDGLQITDASSNGTMVNELLLRRATRVVSSDSAVLTAGVFLIRVWHADAKRRPQGKTISPVLPQQMSPAGPRTPRSSPPQPIAADIPASAPPDVSGSPGADVRRRIHRQLLEHLDLPTRDRAKIDVDLMRPEVVAALRRIVAEAVSLSLSAPAQEALVQELADEALGLGPLERFLSDPDVNEIMVVDPQTIFVERLGKMQLTGCRFTDDDSVRAVIERIVTPLGRRIDESTPLVDARLKDGSRVNAVIPPLALRGPCITIRKFAKEPLRMPDLIRFGTVTAQMACFLERAVKIRKNIVISGGTGSGKTTLLNVLSASIPTHERIVTVEDAAELQLAQPHVVSLEARPPNLEGKGEYSIRDLVKNALRMRPDRIVVGECRGGEAIDMLQAMNTGHEGSLTTTHANSPREAVARIETLCLMAGLDLPVRAIRQQIASSVHMIVQQTRFSDGTRRVTRISEVVGLDDDGDVELRDIFEFKMLRAGAAGRIEGEFLPTGYLPSFLDQFIAHGLVEDGVYL